ncbi:hypothetical protein K2173_006125 [Erythroxylum novogranatense]|uniref:Methyltransferase n=1 Tax=Erythroxylum novogranatense TaxID=1862640 RepID=A0AAV8TEE3_9ROSI|nr:hypothetical protein K2173_006125 [Erythroxylum novogranatense]
MAIGRSRNSKRGSSSSSYISTAATVSFIALSVAGVWMLTSNSVVRHQTTNRVSKDIITTTTDSNIDTGISSSIETDDISATNVETDVSSNEPEKTDSTTTNNDETDVSSSIKSEKKESTGTNNVGTDVSSSSELQKTDSTVTNNVETDVSSSTDSQKTEGSRKSDQPVFEDNPGDLPADAIKSDETKTNNENDKEQSKQNALIAGKTVEESSQEQEKQKDKQNQVSEESAMTQNQKANHESSDGNQQTGKKNSDHEDLNQVSERGQQQNVENQYQEAGSGKKSQDSRNQMDNASQQPQETEQNDKSYEERQQQQRVEESGLQTVSKEAQNDVSEEDQKQRMEQQQQQQQEQKQDTYTNQETQQQEGKQTYSDITTTVTQLSQESAKSTQNTENQVDNQATKQETEIQDATKFTKAAESNMGETSFPGSSSSGIPKESKESKKSWSTQAAESENEKERRKESDGKESIYGYTWQLCNVTAGPDYIPCLDNEKAVKQLKSTKHFEHRERHCPEEGPTCLVSVPEGYKRPITWPKNREKIWYHNVPHTLLAEVKGHQNWVKVTGEFLTFPGGGTQFIHGALHYIDFLEQSVPNIQWGKHTRVVLDVGCGVASFGGYIFDKDVLTMSFAPKDEHEAQVQFALERGIPAISAVMGSQRLPFPSRVFDLIHCARCRVPWHAEGGLLLLELNRVLRPGGYFVWSATPVYQKLKEDVEIWQAMSALTVSMCWELVTIKKDKLNSVGAAIYRKPLTNDCYDQRKKNSPPMCKNEDDPDAAWYVPLQACMHRVPVAENTRGTQWPVEWPSRLQTPPYWLNSSQMGIYGKPAPQDFSTDNEHWKRVVSNSYMKGLGISWSNVRNVMDMRAVYGGFAAALKDLQV